MSHTTLAIACMLSILALSAAPPIAGAYNECVITGAEDPSGPVAPPCFDTRAESGPVRAVQDAACGASDPACARYYVLLIPDRDGDLSTTEGYYTAIVWQEKNGCDGLQRSNSGRCPRAGDHPVLV